MRWIDAYDLDKIWAGRRDCQQTLPLLARKLIRATCHSIQSLHFPAGESILIGGWDGILIATEATEFIPWGTSLWEFGADKAVKGKADREYAKRTANPLGFNPAESTFVFITPRIWKKADEWAAKKKKEGVWKNIKVITAETLEEWIEMAPAVGSWLAKHIGKYPKGGVQPTDDFWEEWSSGNKFNLSEEVLLGGRTVEQQDVIQLATKSCLAAVQAVSREEALAFIISCFKNKPDVEEDFFSRSLIVDNIDTFRELSIHEKPLILIPRFEDTGVLNRALNKGHTIIVPIGADSSTNWSSKIVLPQLDRDAFVAALTKSGLSREFAEKYSRESARNITILRRQLEFTRTLPEWSLPQNVSDIVPALLVGRWDEGFEEDRNVVANIAGDTYESYTRKIARWLHTSDSPLTKIGSTWMLTSPFDAWTNASKFLSRNEFNLLHRVAVEILSEINPSYELPPEQRHMASYYGRKWRFSGMIREGVIQSLILTSIFGDKLKLDLPLKPDLWVDRVIAELLGTDEWKIWKSLDRSLPLISEASPTAFLNAVERSLLTSNSPVFAFFQEEPGLLMPQSYHTGLLWALESLAWFPEYLSRSALILAKLAAVDPGGSLSNRPINSLMEIFKTWHWQTLAPFEERMQVLRLMVQKEPDIAWAVLVGMLPDARRSVAFPTQKARWRMFEVETERGITTAEVYKTHSIVVELLLSVFDFTEGKLAQLIEESVNLSLVDRDKVLSFVQTNISKIEQVSFTAWHALRKVLSLHRSHSEAEWALPENELSRLEKLYEELMPTNEVEKSFWVFNEIWPDFPESLSSKSNSYEDEAIVILEKRKEILLAIYQKFGLEKIIKLSESVKQPWILGETLSFIVNNNDEIVRLCYSSAKEYGELRFIQGFIFRKSILNGPEWVFKLFQELETLGFSNYSLTSLLVPLNQNRRLWDFVEAANNEIATEYWKKVNPNFYSTMPDEKIFGIQKLIEHRRFLSAIHICARYVEEVPSNTIVAVLQSAGTEKADEQVQIDNYEIGELFETLDERKDVDESTLMQLEWMFLPFLAAYGSHRMPKRLHEELSRNPYFFVDVLKLLYRPKGKEEIQEPVDGLTSEQKQNRAKLAYDLLHSWKNVPGMDENGRIDIEFLNGWVKKAREVANGCGRMHAADLYIGQVLAQYPEEKDMEWPPDEICELIESLNSDDVNTNFSCATFNKRSFSSRSPFSGGTIERQKAAYFLRLANIHRNRFPTVTKIFENLAEGYEEDAKRIDEEAERMRLEY